MRGGMSVKGGNAKFELQLGIRKKERHKLMQEGVTDNIRRKALCDPSQNRMSHTKVQLCSIILDIAIAVRC